MSYELYEQTDQIVLRTARYELGWSTDSGALIVFRRDNSPNILGFGPPVAGLMSPSVRRPTGLPGRRSLATSGTVCKSCQMVVRR